MGMPMTPEQIAIVKANFAQVVGQKEAVGMLFYDRLFAIAPETKSLFKGDLRTQSRKLMDTLALAIGMLRDMPTLVTTLEGLAKRHVAYGVKDEHYAQVGDALLWTLQNGLGSAFTADARAAWAALYQSVSDIMRKAAAKPSAF
jgi:nitric oxide dioxygenase